jgi:hypothetical protein
MLTTAELLRAINGSDGAFAEVFANPVFRALRLFGELVVVILTPALIDRHARRSSRILK